MPADRYASFPGRQSFALGLNFSVEPGVPDLSAAAREGCTEVNSSNEMTLKLMDQISCFEKKLYELDCRKELVDHKALARVLRRIDKLEKKVTDVNTPQDECIEDIKSRLHILETQGVDLDISQSQCIADLKSRALILEEASTLHQACIDDLKTRLSDAEQKLSDACDQITALETAQGDIIINIGDLSDLQDGVDVDLTQIQQTLLLHAGSLTTHDNTLTAHDGRITTNETGISDNLGVLEACFD